MAFGFPAYHTDRYSPGASDTADARDAVKKTLSALGWSVKKRTRNQITASTSIGVRSWGERILISFEPDDSISVTSKCALPTQCLDWGKNKANVIEFMTSLEKRL